MPFSVAAMSGEDLKARGIDGLRGLSLATPGLYALNNEGDYQQRISIRGVGNTYGRSQLIGLYLDETSVGGGVANYKQLDLRTYDLERVEVLKGPQGTLYGEGSVGGTIRYITNDPKLDHFAGDIALDGSSTKGGDLSQALRGVLNIPLSDKLGLRFVGQYINSGGWIDQPVLSKSDINDYELFNIRAKLLWQATDNLTIKASATVHRNDVGAQSLGEDEDGNYGQYIIPLTSSSNDDYDIANLLVNYDTDKFSLVSSTSYIKSDTEIFDFGRQCCSPLDATRPYREGDDLTPILSDDSFGSEILSQELRVSSNSTGPWSWSAGLFLKELKASFDTAGFFLNLDIPFIVGVQDESESRALFGDIAYAVTDKLEVGLGLRNYNERFFKPNRVHPRPQYCAQTKDYIQCHYSQGLCQLRSR